MEPLQLDSYRHSGKFAPYAPVLTLGAVCVVAFPLGFAYAYLTRWIPFIYLNVLLTIGYGFGFGWITGWILKRTQARSNGLALACGAAAGLIALYSEWNGHIHALFDRAPLVCRPQQIWAVMQILYEHGSWSFHSNGNITHIALAAVWLVEAAIIVGFSSALPYKRIANLPYCEKTRRWLDEERVYNTLESLTGADKIAALKTGNIAPLLDAKVKESGADAFTRLILKYSSESQTFFTLRVQSVARTFDKDCKVRETTTDLTGDLVLPHDMLDLFQRFATEG